MLWLDPHPDDPQAQGQAVLTTGRTLRARFDGGHDRGELAAVAIARVELLESERAMRAHQDSTRPPGALGPPTERASDHGRAVVEDGAGR